MFETNENRNTVIDIPDTVDDFHTCSETDEHTTEDNSLILLYGRISIYSNDIDCLKEGQFLNDKIIDFVLSVLRNGYGENQTYVFDSMFFIKLRDIQDPKKYYSETSRWFKNGVLSSKNIWVVPVCDNYHWYDIAIIHPETVRPQVLVMDSWKREYYESVDIVKEFLKQKFNAEQGGDIEGIDIPQQKNSYDCGLHVIRSAELFMTELAPYYISLILDPENEITSGHEIYEKVEILTRSQIVRYLIDLFKEQD
ncbi:hypothetical protein INT48_009530 [Thamnidium elegans]|uniref:Ubiquitin-like protease family profile domain-containing protein n=1 Tax=Thamnidium elegans TaxID=101142 RepID=A0A8H7T050_9FUNG|nr:hypothetical protein INT48_009530 [Thamnidium elegans]